MATTTTGKRKTAGKTTRKTAAKKPRSKAAKQAKVEKVMGEYKDGALRSGPKGKGGKVKSRKQAIAIALSESGQSRTKKKTAPRKKSNGSAKKRDNSGRKMKMAGSHTARRNTSRMDHADMSAMY
jgi:hypothetical protein